MVTRMRKLRVIYEKNPYHKQFMQHEKEGTIAEFEDAINKEGLNVKLT